MSPLAWFVMILTAGIAILFVMAVSKFFDHRNMQEEWWENEQREYEKRKTSELRAD